MFVMKRYILLAEITPGPVTIIQSIATQSSIEAFWSAPTTESGHEMCVSCYYVQFSSASESFVKETMETMFKRSNLTPSTFVSLSIRAEYQGRLGPQVYIGQIISKYIW